MKVEIDQNSGYCFGVEYAIQMAEEELAENGHLYCLGDIVHNTLEVQRLEALGLEVITREQLMELHNTKVLIRAHGEPPATYELALANNIELIDASCPVVLKLQNRVKHSFDKVQAKGGQVVIYGQDGHAEVAGLAGQTNNTAIVVSKEEDLVKVDFNKPIALFSQTTKSMSGFYAMRDTIGKRLAEGKAEYIDTDFEANDSICRQVSNRDPQLKKFAMAHDVVVFVSGRKSSNGKALFATCLSQNKHSYFIEGPHELNQAWFRPEYSIGICGATSTPMWLMQQVKEAIEATEELVVS